MKKRIGIISITPKGYGFVTPQKGGKDIFIPIRKINKAIDKDLVEVIVSFTDPKGPDGSVIKILKRKKKKIVGTIIEKRKNSYLAYSSVIPSSHIVIKTKENYKLGDRLLLKLRDISLEADVIKNLGNIKDGSKDVLVAKEEFELKDKFSKKIISNLKNKILKKDLKGRYDFTKTCCITIDPEDAKDFDDAISLEEGKTFKLGVHIADVSYFVKTDSTLDKEAYIRGNSTYFPGRVLPMLPEKLSNDLCSLKENEIRLTVSVIMEFDKEGNLLKSDILRSYIKSKKRYTYPEALKEIEKNNPFFLSLKKLALLLKKKRLKRGSIDFSLPDIKLILNEEQDIIDIKIEKYDISHQIIEEFMLKANEIVATCLNKKKKNLIYRIHEKPSKKIFSGFYTFAKSLGFKLPNTPSHKDIQNLFLQAQNTPFVKQLSIIFLKNMKLALYSLDNLGHYGLSLEHYCHFTSPIRRYSDLIIHRLLFNEEIKDLRLKEIAKNCSEKERNSYRAEQSVIYLKKFRFLFKQYKKKKNKRYKATITKITPSLISFEIKDFFIEGSLHVSEIKYYYYGYIDFTEEYQHGDSILVSIFYMNINKLEIKWKLV